MKVNMINVVEWTTKVARIKNPKRFRLDRQSPMSCIRRSDVQERRSERKMWLRRAGSYVAGQAHGRSPVS